MSRSKSRLKAQETTPSWTTGPYSIESLAGRTPPGIYIAAFYFVLLNNQSVRIPTICHSIWSPCSKIGVEHLKRIPQYQIHHNKFPIAIQNSKYTVPYSKYTSHISNTQSQVQKKYSENKSGQRPLIATRLSNALSFTAGDKFAPSNLIPGRHRNFFSSSSCDLGES